jgi:integrase
MPRKRTGNILREGDHFVARVLLDDGKYGRIHLSPGLSEAKAKEHAAFYAENPELAVEKIEAQKNQKAGVAPIPKGETFAHYAERWLQDRDKRGFSAIQGDRRTIEMYICPHIGEKPIADITREDIEILVQHLDDRTARGEWAWRTARRAWRLIRKIFGDACKSKNLDLRARKDNPTNDIAPPDRGDEKAKAFLWPNEFLQLMTCSRIRLSIRRLYAIAIYLYARSAELLVLRWTDIDLEHGTIKICRGYDRERKREKSTKAGRVRLFAIEPNLLPLLRVMYAERKDDGRVFFDGVGTSFSGRLRRHLR